MKLSSFTRWGRTRLTTMSFSNPATDFCRARNSSAMPPTASLRMSVYLPNRIGMAGPSLSGVGPWGALPGGGGGACAGASDTLGVLGRGRRGHGGHVGPPEYGTPMPHRVNRVQPVP